MTKKSKKKALKTGNRKGEPVRSASYHVNTVPNKEPTTPGEAVEESPEDELGQTTPISKQAAKRLKKQAKLKEQLQALEEYREENNKRIVYPVDLWFQLSHYISPSCVQAFACVCKDTRLITKTANFWLSLYKRFVKHKYKDLPPHLSPGQIDVKSGLKARVVRALFHAHSPFTKRVAHCYTVSPAVSTLESQLCCSAWWKQVDSDLAHNGKLFWLYYFKFVPNAKVRKPNIYRTNDLVSYNTEVNHALLRVAVPCFTRPGNVTGLYLTDVHVGVSRDLCHHKATLVFHDRPRDKRLRGGQPGVTVTFDPIIDVQLLNWWDPLYPHPLDR